MSETTPSVEKSLMNLEIIIAQREAPMAELPLPVAEICDRYEALFTAAINDVLREFGLCDQALPHEITPLRDNMKKCGVAFTIKSSKNPLISGEMMDRARMLDAMPRDCMVVWETGGDDQSAHWGEIMTASSMVRGARGAVVDGGLRDTAQILGQGFSVWNRYRTSNGALSRCKIEAFAVPVRIGQVIVYPGDIVFADIDGAIVIPRKIAVPVLERSEELAFNEKGIREWVERGDSAVDIIARGGYF